MNSTEANELEAQLERDARDAARYRSLRLNAYWWGVGNPTPEELDARIDAAILAAAEQK